MPTLLFVMGIITFSSIRGGRGPLYLLGAAGDGGSGGNGSPSVESAAGDATPDGPTGDGGAMDGGADTVVVTPAESPRIDLGVAGPARRKTPDRQVRTIREPCTDRANPGQWRRRRGLGNRPARRDPPVADPPAAADRPARADWPAAADSRDAAIGPAGADAAAATGRAKMPSNEGFSGWPPIKPKTAVGRSI